MKTKLSLAIRSCLATGAVVAPYAAFALDPSAVPAANVLRFSGATATDTVMRNLAATACVEDDNNVATINRSVSHYSSIAEEGGQIALLCTGANGSLAGDNFAYLKESEAGSANGSVAVSTAAPTPLEFLDIFNAGFVCYGGAGASDGTLDGDAGEFPRTVGTAGSINLGGTVLARSYTNCTGQTTFTAEAGISDVEASLLGIDGGQGTPLSQFQILFGVPVSLNLYRALQTAQGLTSGTCATTPDDPTCVPSLPETLINAIYAGGVADWSQVQQNDGSPLSNVDIPGPAGVIADTSVYICRRGNTSGTQIGTRAYFLRQGCRGGDQFVLSTQGTCPSGPFANGENNGNPYGSAVRVDCNRDGDISDANEGTFNFTNTVVFAGDGSGDVRSCLDDRDDLNRWAIGVLSTDSTVDGTIALVGPGTTQLGNINGNGGTARDTLATGAVEAHQREFRFVRIDGYLPDLAVTADGGYKFYTENVCTSRNGALSGVELDAYNYLCSAATGLRNAANIDPTAFDNQPWGDAGNLGIPGVAGNLPSVAGSGGFTQALIAGDPTGTTTKSFTTGGNNCSAPISFQGGLGQYYLGPKP